MDKANETSCTKHISTHSLHTNGPHLKPAFLAQQVRQELEHEAVLAGVLHSQVAHREHDDDLGHASHQIKSCKNKPKYTT